MTAAPVELAIPRRLAVALYSAAQAQPERVVRGRVTRSGDGLTLVQDPVHSADPVFAAFRSQPEGVAVMPQAELELLLVAVPLVLVVSRATRGVMVLAGFRRSATGLETVAVRIED
jgi:hypothetical protein